MLVASVDLRIVVEDGNRDTLLKVLDIIQSHDFTHVVGWEERYYTGSAKPKAKRILEAVEVVCAKLAKKVKPPCDICGNPAQGCTCEPCGICNYPQGNCHCCEYNLR